MYTAAELFNLATMADAKEVFPDAPILMPKKIGYLKSGKLPT